MRFFNGILRSWQATTTLSEAHDDLYEIEESLERLEEMTTNTGTHADWTDAVKRAHGHVGQARTALEEIHRAE